MQRTKKEYFRTLDGYLDETRRQMGNDRRSRRANIEGLGSMPPELFLANQSQPEMGWLFYLGNGSRESA